VDALDLDATLAASYSRSPAVQALPVQQEGVRGAVQQNVNIRDGAPLRPMIVSEFPLYLGTAMGGVEFYLGFKRFSSGLGVATRVWVFGHLNPQPE
jgi:hypothetical protein